MSTKKKTVDLSRGFGEVFTEAEPVHARTIAASYGMTGAELAVALAALDVPFIAGASCQRLAAPPQPAVLLASVVRIAWTTGERLDVDLAEPIDRLKALAPLRDPAALARVQVGEWGHSLVWAGEIAPGADRPYWRCGDSRLSPM
jgi:hypothetical protein